MAETEPPETVEQINTPATNVTVNVYCAADPQVVTLLQEILTQLQAINQTEASVLLDLTALQAAVTAEDTVEQSAITLLTQISAELQANAGNPAAIQAIVDQINTNASTLAAAVAANTPPAPKVAFDPASNLPLYTFAGTGAIDATVWTAVTDVHGAGGVTLYTNVNDTAGAQPTQASAEWVPYTGTTGP
jgi:hypothetical protein